MIVELSVGAALAGLVLKIRQARIRRRFVKQHGLWIRQENEAIAEAWRNRLPKEKRLLVERTFRPNAFLAPTITVTQRFRRDDHKRRSNTR